jgi:hypothetical protein
MSRSLLNGLLPGVEKGSIGVADGVFENHDVLHRSVKKFIITRRLATYDEPEIVQ